MNPTSLDIMEPLDAAIEAVRRLGSVERLAFGKVLPFIKDGETTEAPKPKRGRPPGSKNRKAAPVPAMPHEDGQ